MSRIFMDSLVKSAFYIYVFSSNFLERLDAVYSTYKGLFNWSINDYVFTLRVCWTGQLSATFLLKDLQKMSQFQKI